MITKLKHQGRFELNLLLALMSIFCLALFAYRFYTTGSIGYIFLNWNLFLAFVPFAMSSLVMTIPALQQKKIVLGMLLCVWLLFFPNSPYILTDLFHLRTKSPMPIWYDLILVLSYAWTGLMYGFVSLYDIESLLIQNRTKRILSSLVIVLLLFVAGFGVYLGRYLRWNSWDIVQNPLELLHDVMTRFINPLAHPRTWGMTILMGFLLNAMFWAIRYISTKHQKADG